MVTAASPVQCLQGAKDQGGWDEEDVDSATRSVIDAGQSDRVQGPAPSHVHQALWWRRDKPCGQPGTPPGSPKQWERGCGSSTQKEETSPEAPWARLA